MLRRLNGMKTICLSCPCSPARLMCWALAISLTPRPAALGQTAAATPEAATTGYMAAVSRGDWIGAAKRMHPEALQKLKQMIQPIFSVPGSEAGTKAIFGISKPVDYDRMTGEQVFERLMRFMLRQSPELASAMRGAQNTVIGHVTEGTELAHVVYRMTVSVNEISVTQTGVVSLKKSGEEWRVLLTGEMEGLAAALAQAAKRARTSPKPASKNPAAKPPVRKKSTGRK
jgi:hypothetical protein